MFLLVINVLQGAQASLGGTDIDWFLWSLTREVNFLVCSILLYLLLSFSNPRRKLLSFLLCCMAAWSLLSFLILSFSLDDIYLTSLCAFISSLPLISFFIFNNFRLKSDKYTKNRSYLVYKRPSGVLGLIAVSLGLKGLGVAMVVRGREFCFLGKDMPSMRIEEREHHFSSANYYKRVEDVDVEHARRLIGTKWAPSRTCLRVFGDFDRPAPCG